MTKPKPVNWELIDTNQAEDSALYQFVNDLKTKYHSGTNGLSDLNFVLMWRHNIRPDQDGYVLLADISKSSDKMRELRPHDVVIGINKVAWQLLSETQRKLIIDMQLERVVVCLDKEDNPKEDDRSRLVYRLKRQEVIDEQIMSRRHNTTLSQVQEYISNRLSGDFDKGSYVDQALNGDANG